MCKIICVKKNMSTNLKCDVYTANAICYFNKIPESEFPELKLPLKSNFNAIFAKN